MPTIHYLSADGQRTSLDVDVGVSVMQAALLKGLPGIQGDCGGACQCATCHVYVDDAWVGRVPPIEDMEDAMLDCTSEPRQPNSRLCCNVLVSEELDGLVVRLPAVQS